MKESAATFLPPCTNMRGARNALLFHQDQPLVEYHQKTASGWLLTEIDGIDAVLTVESLELQLVLNELYEGVDWLTTEE